MKILAIETSCDETAVSVVDGQYRILSNIVYTQTEHLEFGGVVPEVASRVHAKVLPNIIEQALFNAKISFRDLTHIAVTNGPGLSGSLMVGVEAAKSLAYLLDLPLIPINHMAGHVYANLAKASEFCYPVLAIVVSGGHTEIVELNDDGDFSIISQTVDDAVGETFDKVARVLGLGYPGGPKVSKLAESGEFTIDFPYAQLKDGSGNLSFSGLKTAVINYVNQKKMKGEQFEAADVASSFENTIVNTIINRVNLALKDKTYAQIILAGGVSANTLLRIKIKQLAQENNILLTIPDFELCTDNAAMIGLAAVEKVRLLGEKAFVRQVSISPNETINIKGI